LREEIRGADEPKEEGGGPIRILAGNTRLALSLV